MQAQRRKRGLRTIGLLVLLPVIILLIAAFVLYNQKVLLPQQPIARVNDVAISLDTFQKAVRLKRYRLIQAYQQAATQSSDEHSGHQQEIQSQLNSPDTLGKQVLDGLIEDQLVRQEAARRGIVVGSQEVERKLDEFFADFSPSSTAQTGAVQPVEKATGLQTRLGLSLAELRYFLESELYAEKLVGVISSPTATTVQRAHARHNVLPDEATARQVLAKLKAGDDWSKLVAQYTLEKGDTETGGDHGWVDQGILSPEIDTVVFSIPVGSVSEPVKTSSGWQIFQVLERENHTLTPAELDEARHQALVTWATNQGNALTPEGKPVVEIYDFWQDNIPTDPVLALASTTSP